jgi:hypothetical protein
MLRRLLPLVAALAAGCASSARYVDKTPAGGVVAVPDARHRDDALALIKQHVGPGYVIVEEKEVPTGQVVTTTTDQKKDGSAAFKFLGRFSLGRETDKSTTTTGPVTELRIWYTKGGAAPPAVPDTVIQTQYLSPGAAPATPPAGPTSSRNRISPFDTGGTACKL